MKRPDHPHLAYFGATPWVIVVTVIALLACYGPTLRGMAQQWWNDEDMGHGFVVPIVVLWVVWRGRARWQAVSPKPSWWGLPILLAGAGIHLVSVLGAGLFAGSAAFLLSIAGLIVCLGGFARLRVWIFPLLLALFMLPKLAIVYNQLTLPLQLLASRTAAFMLSMTGIGVIREGNILDVRGHRVSVVEACNGVRYLLSLGFMAVVIAYISDPKPWMRFALLLAAVPVAILANAIRVAATAALPALDSGIPHLAAGFVIFLFCLATLVSARLLLNWVSAQNHA